jgi:hypothetical protein
MPGKKENVIGAGVRAAEIARALERDGKLYRKAGEVQAQRATEATPVETVLADGTEETRNVAEPGDYIVTGPGGERYVVKPETFEARYVRKPFARPISIVASWGEHQHGAADCMIADVFDRVKGQRAGEPYLIGSAEFARTYKPAQRQKKK